jgi:hypothetical protein
MMKLKKKHEFKKKKKNLDKSPKPRLVPQILNPLNPKSRFNQKVKFNVKI